MDKFSRQHHGKTGIATFYFSCFAGDGGNFAINLPAGQFCRLFFWQRHALPEALPVLELRSSEDLYDRV